jgi:predicted DNA-binding ribbon-helix-helix protein
LGKERRLNESNSTNAPFRDGKRTGIKLDSATWVAIEWLADQQDQTWQEWCNKIIHATPEDENVTASIRAEAMDGIFSELMLAKKENKSALTQKEFLDEFKNLLKEVKEC